MINNKAIIDVNAELPQCLVGHLSEHGKLDIAFKSQTRAPDSARITFLIQQQLQSNWCWAAVSTSVGNYYYGSGTFTQCDVASAELSRDCCAQPVPCNIYGYLDTALMQTRSFDRMVPTKIQFQEIKKEIHAGRPIGLRCAWFGGGAHFLVINGYYGDYVWTADSIHGFSLYALNAFPANYQSGGSWTHTYFTKKNQESA